MGRIYEELPCGCLVSEDGGGGLLPCCYPEAGQKETPLHKECMRLYFKENKTLKEIRNIILKGERKMKVVINADFGGFGLSVEAQKEINKIGCLHSKWIDENDYFGKHEDIDIKIYGSVKTARQRHVEFCEMVRENGKILIDDHRHNYESRECPVLIQVIERMEERANGKHATLEIVEIPNGVDYTIEEYDGSEWVAEKHRTWS